VVDLIFGLRANPREEDIGMDLTQHNEKAYTVLE